MKIPQALPQFAGRSCLLALTGRHTGRIIWIHDGSADELEKFAEPVPHYSDNEGFFETSGHGRTLRSGAVREMNEQEIGRKFIKETVEQLGRIMRHRHVTDLYVFSPREHEIERHLPREAKEILRETFIGSYIDTPVERLLHMIQQKENVRLVSPISEEAHDLLHRPPADQLPKS